MAEKTVIISQQHLKPIKILKWKVREGFSVSAGSLVLLYDFEVADIKQQRKFKSPQAGSVCKLIAQEGTIVQPGEPLFELSACIHSTVMKDMCAECGADLRKNDINSTASVPMIHSVPELKVSEELAQKIGKADSDRLLKDRKLVLLVDLDQTLIHTTNDIIPPNLKNVYHFQLYGPNSPWYHTRLRPGTHEFLKNVSPYFELHICTFGARNYAHKITAILDFSGEFFSNRVLSRDECFNPTSKTANLKALFPCGDQMVCIIDDREDVWSYASNLIHVKPYHFFKHTGDINAPPGLEKDENDEKEGVDLSNIKNAPVEDDTGSNKENENFEESLNKNNDRSETFKKESNDLEPTSKDKKLEEPKEKDKPELDEENNEPNSVNKESEKLESINENTASLIKEEVNGVEEIVDKSEKKSNDHNEKNCNGQNEKNSDEQKDENSTEQSEEKSDGQNEEKFDMQSEKNCDGQSEENSNGSSEKHCIKQNGENSIKQNENSGEQYEENSNRQNEEKSNEEDPKEPNEKVEQTLQVNMENSLSLNSIRNLIEIEDPDDYLLYLEDILKRIHRAFYEEFDQMQPGEVPDLKKVIPNVKGNVLNGCKLIFSGLVPTHTKLEHSRAFQVAKSLGAKVTENFEEGTTHLVAVRPGTAKVNAGRRRKTLKIVTPDWLWACAERWEHVDEQIFPLNNKGSKNRHPPPHCGSPEHVPTYAVHDTPALRKRTPSGRFMDTINPLMSFSSADIADMDKEVEDILDGESESEGDAPEEILPNTFIKEKEESSSEESLSGDTPRGHKRTVQERKEEDEEDDTKDSDEFPSTKFRRGEQLDSDLDIGQESNSEGSDDPPDEIDDGEWNMMGAALEREFLSNS